MRGACSIFTNDDTVCHDGCLLPLGVGSVLNAALLLYQLFLDRRLEEQDLRVLY
jgi:hypothetical protein